jgi:UDP-glucose 4-epimerase
MKVVVTGGCGFIGSHIAAKLIELGHEVLILDNRVASSGLARLIEMGIEGCAKQCDVTHARELREIIAGFEPDVICHQAGQSSLQSSVHDPMHDLHVNAFGTLNILLAASQWVSSAFTSWKGARVVFASTSAVYAPVRQRQGVRTTLWEGSPLEPISNYGMSKMAAEHYIRNNSSIHSVILRYGNVYGPGQDVVGENQIVPHCIKHLLNGSVFAIHGNGRAQRDYVYIDDVVDANLRAITNPPKRSATLNIGTGKGTSTNTLCSMIAERCRKPAHQFIHDEPKPGELSKVILDSLSAKNALGWVSKTSVEEGLSKTCYWWRTKGMWNE